MQRHMRELLAQEQGQGMTEWVLTAVLVAIAAIGFVNLFGFNLRTLFGASAAVLGGETNAVNDGERTATSAQSIEGSFNTVPGGRGDKGHWPISQ